MRFKLVVDSLPDRKYEKLNVALNIGRTHGAFKIYDTLEDRLIIEMEG